MSTDLSDPEELAMSMAPELLLTRWMPAAAADGVEAAWHGDGGEVLTVFVPTAQSPDDLLAADAANLLAGGTFVPGRPLLEGHHLQGTVTSSTRGPQRLDTCAVSGEDGTRRVVLLRPAHS